MNKKRIAPYGTWQSPIEAEVVAASGTGRGGLIREIQVHDDIVYWIVPRPEENGRCVLMRRNTDKSISEAIPRDFNARTRVHEYGGGDYCVHDKHVFFSNFEDQRLYHVCADSAPTPITPDPPSGESWRYADGCVTSDGRFVICVHERHASKSVVINEIAVVSTDGSQIVNTIIEGNDFFASPRVSPDGMKLTWLAWDHPNMPWDGTELWIADLHPDGTISSQEKIAGNSDEWISSPAWGPDGCLHFLSDRSNWSNLYRWKDGVIDRVSEIQADIDRPAWVFGFTRYTFLSKGRIVVVYWKDGVEHLGMLQPGSQRVEEIETPFTAIPYLASDGKDELWFVGGNFTTSPAIVRIRLQNSEPEVVYQSKPCEIGSGYLSQPHPIAFPTTDGETAYALYYPPTNQDYSAPESERAPLIVRCHGGPTFAAFPYLQLEFQYFTSRGIGVVDVNYRGSTGYGRSYRESLKGKWGVNDTADCIHAAKFLVAQGEVDPRRLIMRGGSAGGWTTLCALTFHDIFKVGASYYGIADAEMLAQITHKFEARYLESLIGPYPEAKQLFVDRSPIHHAHGLSCPLILFQGLEDKVVPPSQSELMLNVLRKKKIPFAYLTFAGEGHGFRSASSVKRCLEAEISFYAQILEFDLADSIEPVTISYLE